MKVIFNLIAGRVIENLVFRWGISKLHLIRHRMHKEIDIEMINARKEEKNHDEIAMLRAAADNDAQLIEQEIDLLVSRHWTAKAERLYLPIPSRREEGMWENCHLYGQWALTNKGISTVRKLVREERAARLAIWGKILAALWTIASTYFGYLMGKGV